MSKLSMLEKIVEQEDLRFTFGASPVKPEIKGLRNTHNGVTYAICRPHEGGILTCYLEGISENQLEVADFFAEEWLPEITYEDGNWIGFTFSNMHNNTSLRELKIDQRHMDISKDDRTYLELDATETKLKDLIDLIKEYI